MTQDNNFVMNGTLQYFLDCTDVTTRFVQSDNSSSIANSFITYLAMEIYMLSETLSPKVVKLVIENRRISK